MSFTSFAFCWLLALANSSVIGTTTVAGRSVIAVPTGILRGVGISDSKDAAAIHFSKHDANVNKSEVQLTSKAPLTIPPACKEIKLVDEPSGIRVFFDGVEKR